MIAALFVETGGCYFGLPGVDPWDRPRDARKYDGPWPVVAHPPCQRWGRYATSHPILGAGIYELGDDDGCFEAALDAVVRWGGVLEHPAHSKAWGAFGLVKPPREGGWTRGPLGTKCCHVEQGFYGHLSRKGTWLCAAGDVEFPDLIWGAGEQRIHPRALELHGYAKARRIGMMAMVGGKDKTKIRNATPPEFRDLLISIAETANKRKQPMPETNGHDITEPAAPVRNLSTFFAAAHDLNSEIATWRATGEALADRRQYLIDNANKYGVHKSATKDALAKVVLSPRVKAAREPEPAPILDYIDEAGQQGAHT